MRDRGPVVTDEKGSVLIVEDSDTLRQMLTMALESRGYHVTGAPDGITALHALAESLPDAILLDLNLPDIDGLELCKRIKAAPSTHAIPILVMTSLTQPGFEIMAIEAGADDFVTKPVYPLVLDARIQMVVRRMRRERFTSAVTDLPSAAIIDERLAFLIERRQPFAVTFVDIDNFKPFNLKYRVNRGDLLLRHVAELIDESLRYAECEDAFVGHSGSDNFVVVCGPEKAEEVARGIAQSFDMSVMDYYGDEDRDRGYFALTDVDGAEVRYGPLTLSIGVMPVVGEFPDSVVTLMDVGLEALTCAREQDGSTVVVTEFTQPTEGSGPDATCP